MVHMLSEEALILAAVLVACGLLLLGVLELLWPTRGRVVRRPPALLGRHEYSLRLEVVARRVFPTDWSPEREPAPNPAALPVTVQLASQISAQRAPSVPVQLTPPFPVQLSQMDEPAPVTAARIEAVDREVAEPVAAAV